MLVDDVSHSHLDIETDARDIYMPTVTHNGLNNKHNDLYKLYDLDLRG